MPGDEYELMPERKLSSMKRELDDFRKKAQNVDVDTGLPRETVSSLENLNKSISSLLGLFQTATEELKLEERDETLISKKLDPLMKKVDVLLDQNEKIAKAIVAIADMVREKGESSGEKEEAEEERPAPRFEAQPAEVPPMFQPPSRPSMMGPPPMPPPRGMPPAGFPPPPPMGAPEPMPPWDVPGPMPDFGEDKPKKKGLFGGLMKK